MPWSVASSCDNCGMQKGGVPATVYLIGGFAVVLGWWWFFSGGEPEPIREASHAQEMQETVVQTVDRAGVRLARSVTTFNDTFVFGGGSVWYRSGTSGSGEKEYKQLPGADASSFSQIGVVHAPSNEAARSAPQTSSDSRSQQPQIQLGASSGTTESGATSYRIAFYADNNNVYIVVESGGQTSAPLAIFGADPDTFQILNVEYVKDANHVYAIEVTCTGNSCTAQVSVVEGADPDTFQAFSNSTQVYNSDCTAFVTVDGQDRYHMFNNGAAVDGVSIYLIGENGTCDDTPVLVSP